MLPFLKQIVTVRGPSFKEIPSEKKNSYYNSNTWVNFPIYVLVICSGGLVAEPEETEGGRLTKFTKLKHNSKQILFSEL